MQKNTEIICNFLHKYDLSLEWQTGNCVCASDFILNIDDINFIMQNNLPFEVWTEIYHAALESESKMGLNEYYETKL